MIYFIQHGINGPIKIGYTKDKWSLRSRVRGLQIGNPVHLSILGILDGDVKIENKLHTKFKKYHIRGEWYNQSEQLLSYILNNSNKHYLMANERLSKRKNINLQTILDSIEYDYIVKALNMTNWDKRDACRLLGFDIRQFRYKIEKLGITKKQKTEHH